MELGLLEHLGSLLLIAFCRSKGVPVLLSDDKSFLIFAVVCIYMKQCINMCGILVLPVVVIVAIVLISCGASVATVASATSLVWPLLSISCEGGRRRRRG